MLGVIEFAGCINGETESVQFSSSHCQCHKSKQEHCLSAAADVEALRSSEGIEIRNYRVSESAIDQESMHTGVSAAQIGVTVVVQVVVQLGRGKHKCVRARQKKIELKET